MKKYFFVLLLTFLFAGTKNLQAQEMSTKDAKEFIVKYKWFLRRYELGDQKYTVPKEFQGTFMIFEPNGKVYYYKNGESGANATRYDWKLSDKKMTLTIHDGSKGTFEFKLEDFIGYKIYLKVVGGDEDGLMYVWEQHQKD